MYKEPIRLQPVFKERIWGGTELREAFGYEIPSETTGECWGISAHPNGPSVVENGPLEGWTLDEVWREHPELFGHSKEEEFPLLTKILDAARDLSVQVHPDDAYAQAQEGYQYGKTECWYVLNCEPGSEIVFGHNAESKEDFQQRVDEGKWDGLLRRVKVKPGDFFYVPSETIHAIGAGIQILETQQSSDITYRVYDYDRRDAEGNLRELHLEQAIDVTTYPHNNDVLDQKVQQHAEAVIKTLVEADYFSVYHWDVRGALSLDTDEMPYLLVSVVEGEAVLALDEGQESQIRKGDHLIIPADVKSLKVSGHCECVVSHPAKD